MQDLQILIQSFRSCKSCNIVKQDGLNPPRNVKELGIDEKVFRHKITVCI